MLPCSASTSQSDTLKRARARSGCFTCRKRKKKCDEVRPICGDCSRLDIGCVYPSPGGEGTNTKRKKLKESQNTPYISQPNSSHPLLFVSPQQSVSIPTSQSHDLQSPEFLGKPKSFQQSSGMNCNHFPRAPGNNLFSDSLYPFDLLELSLQNETMKNSELLRYYQDQGDFPAHSVSSPVDRREILNESGCLTRSLKVTMSYSPSTEELVQRFPGLTRNAIMLFEDLRDRRSLNMPSSPLNYYRPEFLVLALRCRATLYALLAWAGFHAGLQSLGDTFFDEAFSLILSCDSQCLAKEDLLASILVLVAAVKLSSNAKASYDYMKWAATLFHSHEEIFDFVVSDALKWLLKNIAYEEILRLPTSQFPELFTSTEFEFIFSMPMCADPPDSLFVCCEPLFPALAVANDTTRRLESSSLSNREALESVLVQVQELEQMVKLAKPDDRLLKCLTAKERCLHLQVFRVFRMAALLHINRSVLCNNSAALMMRYMDIHLIDALEKLLKTTRESLLYFPLFIAGICCSDGSLRSKLTDMFGAIQYRQKSILLNQLEGLVKESWNLDERGYRIN